MGKKLEEIISAELSKLCKEVTGRGPKHIKTILTYNLVIVKFQLYEEPVFSWIKKSEKGITFVNQLTKEVFVTCKGRIQEVVKEMLQCEIKEMYFDIDIEKSKNIIVITLEKNIKL